MAKMTDPEIIAALKDHHRTSVGGADGTLADQITESMEFYLGEPYGDELQGRSKHVTREVMETVEWMLPYIMELFFASDQAAVFAPESEEDIDAAEQETEYVNHIFYKSNPGFEIAYKWIKDALLQKNGIVKCYRKKEIISRKDKYENMTMEEAALLAQETGHKIISLEEKEGEQGTILLDIKVQVDQERSRTVIENVAPEEFRIEQGAKTLRDAIYVSQDTKTTISELKRQGLKVEDDISDDEDNLLDFNQVTQSRFADDNTDEGLGGTAEGVMREVTVKEEYVLLDVDGDGIAERWKVIRVGNTILDKEEVEEIPFHGWTPIMMSHKFYGLSIADLVKDLQHLKSQLYRNILDNQFIINNGRYSVVEGQVNLDDLLTSKPQGIVREKFKGAVSALPTPELGSRAFDVLAYTDHQIEKRSGVSERSSGSDPKQFNSNTTADLGNRVMTAAEQRTQLVARVFAETGFKSLLIAIHRLGLTFEDPGTKIRTNSGKFVTINPRDWKTRFDMTINVGIGNGSKSQQMFQLQVISDMMDRVVAGGGLGSIVTPTNVYNLAIEGVKTTGRKDPNLFFTRPETDEIPEDEPSVEDQAKMAEVQIKQMEAQIKAGELKIKEGELALDQQKLEFEREQLEFERQQHEDENAFKVAELKLEARQQRAVKLGGDG